MTTLERLSDEALLEGVARDIGAELPVAAAHRGWAVANVTRVFERTSVGVEERWSVDVYGPVACTDWVSVIGHPRASILRMMSSVQGTIEAPTPEALVRHVQVMVENLGLRDLTEPR